MGHIINPVLLRLSYNSFWKNQWVTPLKNISNNSYLTVNDNFFRIFFLSFFKITKNFFCRFYIYLNSFKLYRFGNNVNFILLFNDFFLFSFVVKNYLLIIENFSENENVSNNNNNLNFKLNLNKLVDRRIEVISELKQIIFGQKLFLKTVYPLFIHFGLYVRNILKINNSVNIKKTVYSFFLIKLIILKKIFLKIKKKSLNFFFLEFLFLKGLRFILFLNKKYNLLSFLYLKKKYKNLTIDHLEKNVIIYIYLYIYFFRIRLYKFYILFFKKRLSYLKLNTVNCNFFFFPIKSFELSANSILSYLINGIKINLSYGKLFFSLKDLININYGLIRGIKIRFCGRFTRKQRVFAKKFVFGNVPLNSFNEKIDYASGKLTTRYGVGGIKVWLLKKKFKFNN
uniref:Ribosomal protein S3 n=1 Tax=Paravannella minima TaxID=1443144 RepID=A0A411K7P1_9EUKA|nr:ribosomal protein S3 [Paravannella minima]QBC73429.1 ribosomal protein S3 [Paravannella minima]